MNSGKVGQLRKLECPFIGHIYANTFLFVVVAAGDRVGVVREASPVLQSGQPDPDEALP